MRAIMVMFDSLNRRMLPPYGCDWVYAPNFTRLAEMTVVFDNCWVGSMPCMPARRELNTGRYNFLHRSWGPMEPFDDSMPELLKRNGIHSHLVSDHYHYWEDGGCTYHPRYKTWEISRGQEGDAWKGVVKKVEPPGWVRWNDGGMERQHYINRQYMTTEESQPQAKSFELGLEFIETNLSSDNWFLHIETFDPHEPFFTLKKYKDLYPHEYSGTVFDWPPYQKVSQSPEMVAHCRYEYAALVSMCDAHLGRILDAMDRYNMWEDTMLIVNTDHGFLLGEHGWWAKCVQPFYNEVANTPLFIWDPRCGIANQRRPQLVQTIDLAPTVLEFFGVEIPPDMQGKPLAKTIDQNSEVREAALFGIFGGHVNITDGRYVYMRAPGPDNSPLFEYTLMPTHMNCMFGVRELQDIGLAQPFSFTKGCRTMKIASVGTYGIRTAAPLETLLFDCHADPAQANPLDDPIAEKRMIGLLKALMEWNDAPVEQYARLGL